jgi:hypothetical protein
MTRWLSSCHPVLLSSCHNLDEICMSDAVNKANRPKQLFSERQRRILLALLLAIGLFFVIFYGMRAYHYGRRLIEGTQPIVRPWMTIPHLSQQFKIPEAELYRALDVQPQRPDRRPLDRLARAKGLQPRVFVEQVQRFVDAYHKPPPISPVPTATQALSQGMAHANRPK